DVHYHLTGDDLRILKGLCDCIDRANTDILVLEKCTPLVPRFLTENALDFRLGVLRSTVGQPGKVVSTQGKAGEIGTPNGSTKILRQPGFGTAHRQQFALRPLIVVVIAQRTTQPPLATSTRTTVEEKVAQHGRSGQ